jgi:hypothetical protein
MISIVILLKFLWLEILKLIKILIIWYFIIENENDTVYIYHCFINILLCFFVSLILIIYSCESSEDIYIFKIN